MAGGAASGGSKQSEEMTSSPMQGVSSDIDLEMGYTTTHMPPSALATPSNTNASHEDNAQLKLLTNNQTDEDDRPSDKSSTTTLSAVKPSLAMPQQRYKWAWLRDLRWTVMTVYRRLMLLVILINLAPIFALAAQQKLLSLPPQSISTAVAANITASILVRQEFFVNLLFMSFGDLPRCLPLRIRLLSSKVYHHGGIHSGSAISALIWFVIENIVIFSNKTSLQLLTPPEFSAIISLTVAIDVLLVTIAASSYPTIRKKLHNMWELIHRFGGWLTAVLFWCLLTVVLDVDRRLNYPSQSTIERLFLNPSYWMLLVITVFLLAPWLRLRKVAVRAERLSSHATKLHFTHTKLPFCAAIRLSVAPLKEWHGFAGIPESDGNGFYVLVSKAGDWTQMIIESCPEKLWVRGVPTKGVLHTARMFKSLILVATGSGIGPVMSLLAGMDVCCRIIWSTRDPLATYGQPVIDQVKKADPDAVIINTSIAATRPDITNEVLTMYEGYKAEAVFIISNPIVTKKTVFDLVSRGIPAFAPIFDS